jgi:1-acyl-sn-glycerol-3-phosphate acyltransferase
LPEFFVPQGLALDFLPKNEQDFSSFRQWTVTLLSRLVRALFYHVSRLIAKMLFMPFVRIHVLRPEAGRRKGAWILAANHISHFDPPLIGIAARRKIDWMGMVELFRHPVSAAFFRAIDTFPVDRGHLDRQAVRTALTRLRAGRAVGIFPEGGIRDGVRSVLEGAPARPGVAGLSQMTGAPVVPCVIMGSDRCYALPRLWRPARRLPVWIAFGQALRRRRIWNRGSPIHSKNWGSNCANIFTLPRPTCRSRQDAGARRAQDETASAQNGASRGLRDLRDDEQHATAAPARWRQPRRPGGVHCRMRIADTRGIFRRAGHRERRGAGAIHRPARVAMGHAAPERLRIE